MADIFSGVVNYVGSTLKQAITPDNVRDYTHASKLFVGDQYRLVPKAGFLFHMFIDINTQYADPQNPNALTEIGLMVKSADLPRFTVETKTFNAYNRPNIVQNKIRYDPITVIFHDDSNNLIRNFWTRYLTHYYRDSDYTPNTYRIPHKYSQQQVSAFGYSPQQSVPFLQSIRLYSLHQKRFSEYILINPIIKSFRHGNHAQDRVGDLMQHEMVIEYEAVLYNSGRTSLGNPRGFAMLHYDTMPSPITPAGGGPKSIFGPGGLIDTGKEVADDITNGNYGAALFKAARGINNARGMNLKSTAITELTDQFNQSLKESITSQRVIVPNILGTSSIANTPFAGITLNNAVAALAGVVAIRETRIPKPLGQQRINDIQQSTAAEFSSQITNYNNSFPANTGVVTPSSTSSELLIVNDQEKLIPTSNQGLINFSDKQQNIRNKIQSTTQQLSQATFDLGRAKNQESNATAALNFLNSKLTAALALPDSNPNKEAQVEQVQQSIRQQEQIKVESTNLVTEVNAQLTRLTQELQALRAENDTIR